MTTQHTLVCPSCGVPWVDHLGMTGTCAKLREATRTLRTLKTILSSAEGDDVAARQAVEIIDVTLERVERQ